MTLRKEIDALCRRIAACGTLWEQSDLTKLTDLLLLDSAWNRPDDHLLNLGWQWEQTGDGRQLVQTEEADEPIIVEVRQ